MQQSKFLFTFFMVIMGLSASYCTNADSKILPLEEGYKPGHPIEFPHAIHTESGIDCKYCHNPEINGKEAGMPAKQVCLECHKQIGGNSKEN